MKVETMTELEIIEFLKKREDESVGDYLSRTRDVYYKNALKRLSETKQLLEESKKKIDKIIKKDVENGKFN